MNTSQIHSILSCIIHSDQCLFLGVFPKDLIPSIHTSSFPLCFVANTDPSTQAGEHWVAYFYDSPSYLEFFDSYGLSPSDYDLPHKPQRMNHQTLQSLDSRVCGHYCIFYLYHRSQGISLTRILSSFSLHDYTWNDRHVSRFISKNFTHHCSNCTLTTHCQCCVSRNKK